MLRLAFVLLFGWVGSNALWAQALSEAAAQLAARTSSLLPRRATVSLELQNLTSLPAAEWSNFRAQLQDGLRKAGVETAAASPESRVRVTLSESATGLLFVSEVSSGDRRQIAMLPWKAPSPAATKARLSFSRTLLLAQAEPILDVLLLESGTQMVVLSAGNVASYRAVSGKWMPAGSSSLVLPRPLPRDPRGRLANTPDGFRAYLPDANCTGALQPQLRVTCAPGNENWPNTEARWATDRNWLESDTMRTPFYTTADGFFVTTDGRVQDRAGQSLAGTEGWGSDIAAIDNPCGAAPALIATSASLDREEVRAYEIVNARATRMSDPMPLSGPVTALWPSEMPGQATLVFRNAQTGEYEASRLGLACAR
jgi:hypothetical protein